jgi:hypothetical protein
VLEKREEIEGAITIESEEEVFLDRQISEKNAEKELVKRLEKLKGLRKEIERLNKELEKEKGENRELQEINKKFHLLPLLTRRNTNKLLRRLFKVEGKIYKLEKELKK